MSPAEIYEVWAPPARVWSQWAKPALFTYCAGGAVRAGDVKWPKLDAPNDRATALVIDLPRALAAEYGIAAARDGYWPVPLFNCAYALGAVLRVESLIDRLAAGAEELAQIRTPLDAPPAFLIDSKRMAPEGALLPGHFDNRYVILPQDFPSAGFLKRHGITRALWITDRPEPLLTVRHGLGDDLAHVLLRWQEGGIEMFRATLEDSTAEPLRVRKPSWFRSLFYRAYAMMGLRRNSAGGFGAVIPQPSSGGG